MKVTITVCVCSSCHIRGARRIIERYSELIASRRLKDDVLLKGSFCMDRCTEGVNMEINGKPFSARSLEDAERLFEEEVMPVLGGDAPCPS